LVNPNHAVAKASTGNIKVKCAYAFFVVGTNFTLTVGILSA
jgi:hypothetical protein